ncbi:hypothetical protein ACQP2Y_11520 [Actinoplanes sp. CA-051413]|uniref:hypothetical protein n=1 Tax=Actinoplanes sp. CA-051413 TaxID=3239899 RepID=UPI003D97A7B6
MRIELVTGDITAQPVDAIVNALHAAPPAVDVVRLVLFDEQTRYAAERVHEALEYGR